ncbi:MAG: beta-N-acetylhexosaminidase [Kiritimatiellae bacterium]|nr:beta-N-acetylhexosaminidase [Kiritimatiellia bacterium]MDD5521421.1 beta-N-acetylhexosaminidase [Kiritimatiellia bacterium]
MNYNQRVQVIMLWTVLGLFIISFQSHVTPCCAADLNIKIIPKPTKIEKGDTIFTLNEKTVIIVKPSSTEVKALGSYLSDFLAPAMGARLTVKSSWFPKSNSIVLRLNSSEKRLGDEGYMFKCTPRGVTITAAKPAGIFYGIQTLRQLLPVQIESRQKVYGVAWTVPCLSIEDQPRFQWRGMLLDPARHFITKDYLLKYIDLMALYKLNQLQLHLTDDQGWRIEIKKYPRLTESGSIRKESPMPGNRKQGDGKPYGPFFYTQDQIREIVAYAAKRFVTIVPEIEMPGHSLAASVAFPELSCTGGPFEIRTKWGIEPDIYCAGNDKVFEFVQDILTEVMDMFPSTFIHIGGDEAPKDRWNKCPKCQARIQKEGLKDTHELQSYFVRRIDKFLASKGRRLIGWDEILEGGLAPGAAVMSWRGIKGGIAAAGEGHDVVMSPTTHCYFDYAQAKGDNEPEAIGGFLPLEKVYDYEPIPDQLSADRKKHILGAQGNVWGEYMWTPQNIEYFSYPRACALAEVVWTPLELKNLSDFLDRFVAHEKRLDVIGVNYRKLDGQQK